MEITALMPKWQKELISFKGIKSTFIIEGNISDVYPTFIRGTDGNEEVSFGSLIEIVTQLFNSGETEGFYEFQYCDPVFGFTDPLNSNIAADLVRVYDERTIAKQQQKKIINFMDKRESHDDTMMIRNSEIIRTSMTEKIPIKDGVSKSIVNVINFASRFLVSPDNMNNDEVTFFLNLLYASNSAIKGKKYINTLVLIVNKLNDIPAWFFINNPNVRTIAIPNPDRAIRNAYIDVEYTLFNEVESQDAVKLKRRFVDLTEGMKLRELQELRSLYDKTEESSDIATKITDVVSIYKYGFKENKWEQIKDRLEEDMVAKIEERVKGQTRVVEKIVRIIKRAVVGLSGLQHSSNTKPKGILFLAGPTGTGKTEVVKAVTELLFEDEKALIRFDMSEYTAEHTDQKLFGAPPGFAGYDSGGQLTNAVKNNPFAVLLFDEIEKAHPNIMDKFLQILEDGRMTDGQGNTVYFSETLIFFTSNVGVSREIYYPGTTRVAGRENIVSPDEPYDVIEEKITEAMNTHFKPEVLNRIGENIAVFNYISRDASEEIAKSQIANINGNLLRNNNITIVMNDDAYKLLFDICWQDKTRENGGRGIGNVIEEMYINPLAEYMFDNSCKENDVIHVAAGDDSFVFSR